MAHLVNLLYEKPRTQELVYTQHTILTDELVMGNNGAFVPYGKPYLCAEKACYVTSVSRRCREVTPPTASVLPHGSPVRPDRATSMPVRSGCRFRIWKSPEAAR